MSKVEVDHHLLFGLLALQTGLINQGALFTAFNAWTQDKNQSMAEILVKDGALDAPCRALLEGLVATHLEVHGGDVEKSLAAIEAGPSTREQLARLEDPDLNTSITRVGMSRDPLDSPGDRNQPTKGSRSSRQEQLLADQRDCWKRGERVPVEVYLERHPDLRANPEAMLDLIYHEVVLREQIGEEPTAEEYIGRFPPLTDAIREQFEIHCLFTQEHLGSESGDRDPSASYSVGTTSSGGLRFRVLRPHAKGGLGAVFVALDSELHREVALKQILDRHADDPVSRSRFIVEAEITGGLEHPGIVPVYGLGNYANGRPFYAMRFIQGDSLKAALTAFHADASLKGDPGRRSLELRKLLRRFVDVCNAIEYAHSRGVLHRDIKPGNIIVGKHGETLVVDWGLAKSVGRSKSDEKSKDVTLIPKSLSGMVETLEGSALGTPAFMSPEQAKGELDRLGPQSDVYSLGATLFMLLTGRPPFGGSDLGAVLQAVQKGRFSPPRMLDPSIDRSLDAICLKAMALSAEDRYSSPRSLAEDIERWTADEPVSARPEPLSERARRWTRHHRTLVTTAAAVLLFGVIGLSAFAAVVSDKNRKLVAANTATKKAETLADVRLDRAMASIEDYFTGFNEDALKGGQLPPSLRDRLLAKPLRFYEELAAELSAKPSSSERERALLAKGHDSLARILNILGKHNEARTQFEAAIASYETLVRMNPNFPEYQARLAINHNGVGHFLRETGRHDDAATEFKKAVAIQEVLAERRPGVPDYQDQLSESHGNVGNILYDMGRSEAAAAAYAKAIAIDAALVERYPDEMSYQLGLATCHGYLGNTLAQMGRSEEAVAEHKKGVTIAEAMVTRQPDTPTFQYTLALSLSNLGASLVIQGRRDEAVAALEKAVAVGEPLVARYPDVPAYQARLSSCQNNLGNVLRDLGRRDEALATHKKAVKIREAMAARYPDIPDYQYKLAGSHNSLGNVYRNLGRLDEAVVALKTSVSLMEIVFARQPRIKDYQAMLAMGHYNLGNVLYLQGSRVEALSAYQRAGKLALPGSPVAVDVAPLIPQTEAAIALTNRLPAILSGEVKPKDAAEGIEFARLCHEEAFYAAAARLWADAFAAAPNLVEDRQGQRRYDASCAAALAAAGKGKDEPALDDDAKAKLRAQARDWLNAELAAWTKVLETGPPRSMATVVSRLDHWRKDADLAGIREPDALEKLPEAERKDWQDLWAEVGALLQKAREGKP